MDYQERKLQTTWLDPDIRDGLLLTFRGVGKKAIAASRRFSLAHRRLQKNLSDSAIYDALRGDPAWEVLCQVLEDLASEVRRARALLKTIVPLSRWDDAPDCLFSGAPDARS